MRVLFGLLLSAGLLSAEAQEPTLWQFVYPEAKLLLGVDLARAKASPTGRMLAQQFQSMKGASVSNTEFLDIADRVLVSSPGGEQGQHARVLVAVEGRMDRTRLRKLIAEGTSIERFHGVDLLVPPKRKMTEMLLAVVNDKLALLGDRPTIELALESAGKNGDNPLLARAQELAAANEIWAVSTVPPASAAGEMMAGPKQLEDIETLDFGLNLQKGLGLSLALGMKNAESAQALATMAQAFVLLASQDSKQNPQVTQIAKSLKIQADGVNVRVGMQVSVAQLERGVIEVKAGLQTAGKRTLESLIGTQPAGSAWPSGLRGAAGGADIAAAGPMTSPRVIERTEPPVPKTRTIRVIGLEEGEKEITYTSNGRK